MGNMNEHQLIVQTTFGGRRRWPISRGYGLWFLIYITLRERTAREAIKVIDEFLQAWFPSGESFSLDKDDAG